MPVRSILLVEDDSTLREATQRHLERAGYEVTAAADGDEAEKILGRMRVDVLLTDIIMPNRDGFELIQAAQKKDSRMRIIAMSGGGEYLSAALSLSIARELHAEVVLQKPFKFEALLSLLGGSPSK